MIGGGSSQPEQRGIVRGIVKATLQIIRR